MSQDIANVVKATSYAKIYKFSDGRQLTDYQLRVQLRARSDEQIVNGIDRIITQTQNNNTEFYLLLTKDDLDIAEGQYILGAEITNTATNEATETIQRINIVKEWVF